MLVLESGLIIIFPSQSPSSTFHHTPQVLSLHSTPPHPGKLNKDVRWGEKRQNFPNPVKHSEYYASFLFCTFLFHFFFSFFNLPWGDDHTPTPPPPLAPLAAPPFSSSPPIELWDIWHEYARNDVMFRGGGGGTN